MTDEEKKEMMELMSKANAEAVARVEAKNKQLQDEIEKINAREKEIADMKPWDIECAKLNKTNIKSSYGKECMARALNAYLSENNEERKSK